jgi:hypothetical protein
MSNPIKDQVRAEYNAYRVSQGLKPLAGAKRGRVKLARSVSLSEEAWTGLQAIAGHLGHFHNHVPSVSVFLEALGMGQYTVGEVNGRADQEG